MGFPKIQSVRPTENFKEIVASPVIKCRNWTSDDIKWAIFFT